MTFSNPVGEPPLDRESTRKLSADEAKLMQEDKERLTEHFIRVLPGLLDKYKADSSKLEKLLCIPQYFELDVYEKAGAEENLSDLLARIRHILERSHNEEVLEAASGTLEYMATAGTAVYETCEAERISIIEAIVVRYREAIAKFRDAIDRNEEPSADLKFSVLTALQKVAVFYGSHDLNGCGITDCLFRNLREMQHYGLREEVVKYCVNACYVSLISTYSDMKKVGTANRYLFVYLLDSYKIITYPFCHNYYNKNLYCFLQ